MFGKDNIFTERTNMTREDLEDHEPECECRQIDVDLFDSRGCEFHDPLSSWNVRKRALTAIQEYEQAKEKVWVG
jgi:hypothetical protein